MKDNVVNIADARTKREAPPERYNTAAEIGGVFERLAADDPGLKQLRKSVSKPLSRKDRATIRQATQGLLQHFGAEGTKRLLARVREGVEVVAQAIEAP